MKRQHSRPDHILGIEDLPDRLLRLRPVKGGHNGGGEGCIHVVPEGLVGGLDGAALQQAVRSGGLQGTNRAFSFYKIIRSGGFNEQIRIFFFSQPYVLGKFRNKSGFFLYREHKNVVHNTQSITAS